MKSEVIVRLLVLDLKRTLLSCQLLKGTFRYNMYGGEIGSAWKTGLQEILVKSVVLN